MSVSLILNSSWVTYDDYKRCKGQNPDIFCPTEMFELDFLVSLISRHYPQYTEMVIHLAINHVKRSLYGGCKRSLFVELVLANLMQRQPLVMS